jgi:hypothetical protein
MVLDGVTNEVKLAGLLPPLQRLLQHPGDAALSPDACVPAP